MVSSKTGSIVLLVVIFGGIFLVLFSGVFGYIFIQHRFEKSKVERERAFQIAEAGANYYRWYLSRYPDDLTAGTGEPGPYEYEYTDFEGAGIGKFSLEISGILQCNSVSAIDITSTGWTYEEPGIKRIVKARHSRPSVAEYAYILNDNVWVGSDREIKGRYHSNGGIRMDGESESLVTSAKETWQCVSSFGCNPEEEKPGIFGDGEGEESGLWQFPVEQIDVVLDQPYGISFGPSNKGYHVIFKNDGTFDIYNVISTDAVYGYSMEQGWHWDYHIIESETFLQNRAVPEDCGLIFIEDVLWLEGEVKGKVSIAAEDIILNGNITYAVLDGSDGLLAVAENDVLIPLYSPDQMELRGIFLAQEGHFGRNHYNCGDYSPWCDRERLEMHGSVVSDGRVGTQWVYGGGAFASGYRNRENSYDRKLMTDPPPMTPSSDEEYKFTKWEELQ